MMTTEEPKKNPEGTAGDRGRIARATSARGGGRRKSREDPRHPLRLAGQRLREEIRPAGGEVLKETSDPCRSEEAVRFLEAFIRKELESLSDRVKTEQAELTESGKELSREIRGGRPVAREEARAARRRHDEEPAWPSQRDPRSIQGADRGDPQPGSRDRDGAVARIKDLRVEKTDRGAGGVFTGGRDAPDRRHEASRQA